MVVFMTMGVHLTKMRYHFCGLSNPCLYSSQTLEVILTLSRDINAKKGWHVESRACIQRWLLGTLNSPLNGAPVLKVRQGYSDSRVIPTICISTVIILQKQGSEEL